MVNRAAYVVLYWLGEVVEASVQSDADQWGDVHSVSDDEVAALFQRTNETQQKDLVTDELAEQRQTVVQAAATTSTVLRRRQPTNAIGTNSTTAAQWSSG